MLKYAVLSLQMPHYLHLCIHTVVVLTQHEIKYVQNTIFHHLPVIPSWKTQPPQIPPAYTIPCQPLVSWPCFPMLYGLFCLQLQVCLRQPPLLLPWGFQAKAVLSIALWFPKCTANLFPLPLFLAQLLVLKYIFLYVSIKYNHVTSIITWCVVTGIKLAGISHSTAIYCPRIMKRAPTLMTATVDLLPPNLVEKHVGFLKKAFTL